MVTKTSVLLLFSIHCNTCITCIGMKSRFVIHNPINARIISYDPPHWLLLKVNVIVGDHTKTY